jgi:hypothetical protein
LPTERCEQPQQEQSRVLRERCVAVAARRGTHRGHAPGVEGGGELVCVQFVLDRGGVRVRFVPRRGRDAGGGSGGLQRERAR